FRPAGRAFSSGFACSIGWPGGASGRRIESTIDFFRRRLFEREDFMALAGEFLRDAKAQRLACQLNFCLRLSSERVYASLGCCRARTRLSIAFEVSLRCFC